jgi:hypothetical protein
MEKQLDTNQLTYRFLERTEQSFYMDFYDQFNNILGVSKDQLLYHRTKEELSFLNDDRKTVGAFTLDGQLLTTISGHFSEKTKNWYAHGHFSNTRNSSLNQNKTAMIILYSLHDILSKYAESKEYFTFYTRRSVAHSRAIDKANQRLLSKNILTNSRYFLRYDRYTDGVYPAGVPIDNVLHRFYTAFEGVDSMVVKHVLKSKFRDDYYKTKFESLL